MLIGIYKIDYHKKAKQRIDIYKKILDYNDINYIEVEISQPNFWELITKVDLFIFRWAHIDDHHQLAKTILPIIEYRLGIQCFPNQSTCWHFDDKIKQYYLLKQSGFPIVNSWVFWAKKPAIEWAKNAEYPVVFKLKSGAGSTNVVLIKSFSIAKLLIDRIFGKGIRSSRIPITSNLKYYDIKTFLKKTGGPLLLKFKGMGIDSWVINKNYAYFQSYLPNNTFDTRVAVIGERAFAFRRFVRQGDFRASGSGKIDENKDSIDIRCVKIAHEISSKLKFQSMAYDFLLNEVGNPEICEISYSFVDELIYSCPGYWDKNLIWHEGNYWPQYLHLKDSLRLNDLKQPDI